MTIKGLTQYAATLGLDLEIKAAPGIMWHLTGPGVEREFHSPETLLTFMVGEAVKRLEVSK